ncbi:aldehyde dehydrogenase (NADP(+)) [Lampropedia aestuarii]|uniref:aldehyde dehydrogenase (NADP(+)) n=1 Tax=Lampropedia aestuarii TaxID=2562762 RepID=UPI002468EA68|nr:aldehyde dehydrogenase (NADP(+)) [Lampropedia aestuarii]MDH5856002.1 aldehyde dehydrogenase (NADP(+)) [Lampropedia aestuarii]
MTIRGEMLIGQQAIKGTAGSQKAFNPSTNAELEPSFGFGGAAEVNQAAALAEQAFDRYRATSLADRAAFLERIADEIMAIGDVLLERAHAETGLPLARLTGERGRTVGQLRLFAELVRSGRFLTATIDPAQPQRQPLPRSDLRLAKVALGPVAVFGASNFPLAFSVAGGDTASALAAGCPVVVKGHSAHLGTSELVGQAIQKAVAASGLPEGVFSLIFGAGGKVGDALVKHPAIKAVGFTGSRNGGLALVAAANARPEPIPVYAEMSAVNPVFLFPAALQARGEAIGKGFADSLTMGAGQFCTNPGLVVAVEGPGFDSFLQAASAALETKPASVMLTPGIHKAYTSGIAALDSAAELERVAQGTTEGQPNTAQANLYVTTAENYLANHALQAEVFGPASVVVTVRDVQEFVAFAEKLEGQLTATLQLDQADYAAAAALVPVLERKVGRILVNGFPTGVEVSHAMVHGGPFPATSNGAFTSVGTSAIDRFLRPVCYQDFPDALLPTALQQANPDAIARLVDGVITLP